MKERTIIHKKYIHFLTVGIINGLWANALWNGWNYSHRMYIYPSNTFMDFKLTGLQGDVMKESMNVAKTLSWKLTPDKTK